MRTAPYYTGVKDWLNTGQPPNYTAVGDYRGYFNDGGSSGQTHTWVNQIAAFRGQPVEMIMGSCSLSLSNITACVMGFQGCPQHIVFDLPISVNGVGLTNTKNGTNDHFWIEFVTALNAAGIDHQMVSVCTGWEFGFGSFDDAIGPHGQTLADVKAARKQVHDVMVAHGFTGTFIFDTTGLSQSQITAGWGGPGQDDMLSYHCYNGKRISGYSRTDWTSWWNTDMKPWLDWHLTFCRNNGLLFLPTEMGDIQPAASDTTSLAYTAHMADSLNYWTLLHDYFRDNSDVCVGFCDFNQDQASGGATTEFTQREYIGTNPASQLATYPHSTAGTGTVYDRPTVRHPLTTGPAVRAVMVPGSMQIASTGGGGGTVLVSVDASNRPQILAAAAF